MKSVGESTHPNNLCRSVKSVGEHQYSHRIHGIHRTFLLRRASHRLHRLSQMLLTTHPNFCEIRGFCGRISPARVSVNSVDSVGASTHPNNLCRSVKSVGESTHPNNLCRSVKSVGEHQYSHRIHGIHRTFLLRRASHRLHRLSQMLLTTHPNFCEIRGFCGRISPTRVSVNSVKSVGESTHPNNLCRSVKSVGEYPQQEFL